jgi:type I restriction enzyme, R subunit
MPTSNFTHLQSHDPDLKRLGRLAERYLHDDPNTSLLKLRQFAELLAQTAASRLGVFRSTEETQFELLRRLEDEGVLPRDVLQLFHQVRKAGNDANHAMTGGYDRALACLKIVWQLSLWSHRTFTDPAFVSHAFVLPEATTDPMVLQAELERLRQESLEAERLRAELEARLIAAQTAAVSADRKRYTEAANRAAQGIVLDEAETRKLIDQQLRDAQWMADSSVLTHAKGARPERGKNQAIAEWPTSSGPADYMLFVGLQPVAVVEAKRKTVDVSAALQQAKRYSRDVRLEPGSDGFGAWGGFRVPFVFATNGRAYLRQLATRSGVWFCDVRRPENVSGALDGWHSPEGLNAMLKLDVDAAHKRLETEGFVYDLKLRPYQQTAIRAVEAAIAQGQREMLLAMATGTGKTKTCIALVYRLLKTQRFRRVLFLVDRSALGEQAANAFKDTRLENLQTFADTFGLKDLEDASADSDTGVHVATVQGMVQRIQASADAPGLGVDEYDCIIVDECHRGYLLDRELSDTELGFRGFEEYVSKYRRVLEHFDAVKIGLTATPALHTTEIFGLPVFAYSYREAVIDGFLVDHEPPVQIKTELSQSGISWKRGEEVKLYNPRQQQVDLFTTPDEITLEVEAFNRKVITESFNQVVCEYLAKELDPASRQKTLVFCANDAHADLVVMLLKQAFAAQYGSVDDDAVVKITGTADKPLQLIRRYKNERQPNVAVTVDLLTTGIDVPEITNLVFLRRVNSRILFDQMLGRATRLCDEIGKEAFRVFDAVQIYEALQDLTAMQPVVVDPAISFTQLLDELARVSSAEEQDWVRAQLIAKLRRKQRRMNARDSQDFETGAGMTVDAFLEHLRDLPSDQIGAWFAAHGDLGEILDRKNEARAAPVFISEHEDRLLSVEAGYGQAQKPEDYINAFTAFVQRERDRIPALLTVLTRPKDLTRAQLRELALELDKAGFTETNLSSAWRQMTNQDIAARIVGFVRQAAMGETLIPFSERVDTALKTVLGSRTWTTPQRQWLTKIAAQTKANQIVDRATLDDPDQLFKREGGGFSRLDKLFDGQLEPVLSMFNEAIWPTAA